MVRILLVDDHSVVRRGLRETLAEAIKGAQCGEAGSGPQAMQLLANGTWDVVVLDISLPGRSGMEVLKDIQAKQPKLPVLMLSMHPEDQYAVRALKAGAAGYLTKESAPEELAAAVKAVLQGRRYVSRNLAELLAAGLGGEAPDAPHETLSDREFEVLRLLASGKTVGQIAAQAMLSVKTVSTYRSRLLEKMNMKTTAELTAYAVRRGLIE